MLYDFNPATMVLPCESKDSLEYERKPIILALGAKDSMERLLPYIVNEGMPRLILEAREYDIMSMKVGNVTNANGRPIQITRFASGEEALNQFKELDFKSSQWNTSYVLPWYFAAKHTKLDCYDKRGQKGFLFTFGDDGPAPSLAAHEVREVFGKQDSLGVRRLTASECLKMASEKFNCYHIIMKGYAYDSYVESRWRELMGSHVCILDNHKYMPELVTTILSMYEGYSKTEALAKLDDFVAKKAVEEALKYHEELVTDN